MDDRQPSSRTCFLCGRQNEIGFKMTWHNDDGAGQVWSVVTVPEQFNGYPNVVHGGIVAAILDETAGRALLLGGHSDDLMVTLKLEVKYRRPTPTDTPLKAVGWMVKRARNRAQVAGEIRLPDGTVTAECEAIIVRPPADIVDRFEEEKPYWKVYDE